MTNNIHTIEDMLHTGKAIAQTLKATDIITLSGDLGAGKTTLSKGILSYFGIDPEIVTSPTFSLMNVYHATVHNDTIKQIVHIDTYRLDSADELFEIGFEDYVTDPTTVVLIEWPELLGAYLQTLPNQIHHVAIMHTATGRVLQHNILNTN